MDSRRENLFNINTRATKSIKTNSRKSVPNVVQNSNFKRRRSTRRKSIKRKTIARKAIKRNATKKRGKYLYKLYNNYYKTLLFKSEYIDGGFKDFIRLILKGRNNYEINIICAHLYYYFITKENPNLDNNDLNKICDNLIQMLPIPKHLELPSCDPPARLSNVCAKLYLSIKYYYLIKDQIDINKLISFIFIDEANQKSITNWIEGYLYNIFVIHNKDKYQDANADINDLFDDIFGRVKDLNDITGASTKQSVNIKYDFTEIVLNYNKANLDLLDKYNFEFDFSTLNSKSKSNSNSNSNSVENIYKQIIMIEGPDETFNRICRIDYINLIIKHLYDIETYNDLKKPEKTEAEKATEKEKNLREFAEFIFTYYKRNTIYLKYIDTNFKNEYISKLEANNANANANAQISNEDDIEDEIGETCKRKDLRFCVSQNVMLCYDEQAFKTYKCDE